MRPEQEAAILDHYCDLKQMLRSSYQEVMDWLIQKRIITLRDKVDINAERTPTEKMGRILDFVLCSEDPEVFFLFVEAVGHVDQYLAGSLKSSATEHRKISFKNQTRVSPDPHEGYHSNFGSGGSCHRIKPEVSMSLNSMPPECCHGDHAQPISDIYNMYGHCSFHAHQLSGNWPPGRDCKHSFRAGCGIDHRPTPTISSKSEFPYPRDGLDPLSPSCPSKTSHQLETLQASGKTQPNQYAGNGPTFSVKARRRTQTLPAGSKTWVRSLVSGPFGSITETGMVSNIAATRDMLNKFGAGSGTQSELLQGKNTNFFLHPQSTGRLVVNGSNQDPVTYTCQLQRFNDYVDFGFKIMEGSIRPRFPGDQGFYISHIADNSIANQEQKMAVNDTIISVNGQEVERMPKEDLTKLFERSLKVHIVLERWLTSELTRL